MNIYDRCRDIEDSETDTTIIRTKLGFALQGLEKLVAPMCILQLGRYLFIKKDWDHEHTSLAKIYAMYHTYCLFFKTPTGSENDTFLKTLLIQ